MLEASLLVWAAVADRRPPQVQLVGPVALDPQVQAGGVPWVREAGMLVLTLLLPSLVYSQLQRPRGLSASPLVS